MIATRVAGVHNTLADDLSKDRLSSFLQAADIICHHRAMSSSSAIVGHVNEPQA